MARERNGYITMRPADFFVVEGSPYYPPGVAGEQSDHPVPARYRCVSIDGQTWVAFEYHMGNLHTMKQKVDELNKGIGIIDEVLKGARFAVGPSFYWSQQEGHMVKSQDGYFPYRIYVNIQPPNDPKNIIQVQEVHF